MLPAYVGTRVCSTFLFLPLTRPSQLVSALVSLVSPLAQLYEGRVVISTARVRTLMVSTCSHFVDTTHPT
jgi:hypothetical protein